MCVTCAQSILTWPLEPRTQTNVQQQERQQQQQKWFQWPTHNSQRNEQKATAKGKKKLKQNHLSKQIHIEFSHLFAYLVP